MEVRVDVDPNHTLYAVKAWMPADCPEIVIGKLGAFSFQKGLYVYVGSARRHLRARVERHLRVEKKLRWHFDYLRPHLNIIEVVTYPGEEGECQLFHRLMGEHGGLVPVRGFGSSDCDCLAHLFHVPPDNL